ncbi:MAG: 23S rRNA (adenine(2503)-C(2))-methyltransferase RlmN [Gammaproteobacteria bacterium]|nr:23S rRNA (adenine(2503)-C(2))-methyltransferase RlmN [Gammaproteobacteria bacterium]
MRSVPAPAEKPLNAEIRPNLLGLDQSALSAFFATQGERPFRAAQVMKWLHQVGETHFDSMTNLSKTLRQRLIESSSLALPEIVHEQHASDGVRKWLLRLPDGNAVETVFIPETDRGTLCVSSQVGCTLNCSFCATARQGFNRNLEAHEIIAQVWLANKALGCFEDGERRVSNVVMMGMGEPLLNFDNVVQAMRIMLDDNAYGLSKRRITLSTAGVVPAIDRLREACDVSLAVSLHATNNALRDQLVPINQKYPIEELLAACRRYIDCQQRRRITFEYVMLAGINDRPSDAKSLIRILEGIPSKVNLIPFNPFTGADYRCSDQTTIDAFRKRLQDAGLVTVTRKTRGEDIDAACGQLAGKVQDRTRRSLRFTQFPGTRVHGS